MFKNDWSVKASWTPTSGKSLYDAVCEVRGYDCNFYTATLCDNVLLYPDMEKAATIIKNLPKGSRICIVSDYDCDGVISAYVLYRVLTKLGYVVDYILPDRFLDGYGISDRIIEQLKQANYDLVITCDNGITYTAKFKEIHDSGTKVIITDHHQPQNICCSYVDAIVNPHLSDNPELFKDLCGAGVVLYLAEALGVDIREYIEYVAIATVCDSVPLLEDNRAIVSYGLRSLPFTRNKGLKALCTIAKVNSGSSYTVYDLGFLIGPRINAAGRLDSANLAMDLLLADTQEKAERLAEDINNLNTKRQKLTETGVSIAEAIISKNFKDDAVIALYSPAIHESVQGIVAGKLTEKYGLPSVVLTMSKDVVKGSARSIPGFDIRSELAKHADLLIGFGGHPSAAGLTLDPGNTIKLLRELTCDSKVCRPPIVADVSINLNTLTTDDILELKLLEPHGAGNARPTFSTECTIEGIALYDSCIHLILDNKMRVPIFGDLAKFKAELKSRITPNQYELLLQKRGRVKAKMLMTLSTNKYKQAEYVQPQVKYIQIL